MRLSIGNKKKSKSDEGKGHTHYNLDNLDGIEAIPIPVYSKLSGMTSPENNIEYILQRKATEHRKNGRIDLAIACLRKANEIFPHSNFFWSEKDYLRLVEYLKIAGRFEEADQEERLIKSKNIDDALNSWKLYKLGSNRYQNSFNTDLIITSEPDCVCSECAKYTRRIMTEYGQNKNYPIFPEFLKLNLPEHEFCIMFYYPYLDEYSIPHWINFKGNARLYSNRPFKDERNVHQKQYFRERVISTLQERIDRKNYDILRKDFSEIAPKSFGGFRRMKNLKSKNYVKLVETCDKHSVFLDKKPDLSIYNF